MVLEELGQKIRGALATMAQATVIDETVLNKLVNSIALALLQADVDVTLVKTLQTNIKKKANLEEAAAGHNRRRLVQQVMTERSLPLPNSCLETK